MRLRFAGLWQHPDFLRFWAAQAISEFGSQVTLLALPLIAAITLHASPFEVGVLAATGQAPFLLIGLFAGAWIDRRRRRPVLVGADLGRALILLAIPVAAAFDALSVRLLYAVSFGAGVLTCFFDISYLSFLPSLVNRDRLIDANSKLETSRSIAQVGGPGLAGILVGLVSAPFAILADACSFLVSALCLWRIRTAEPEPEARVERTSLWAEIGFGLRYVAHHAVLRALVGCGAVTNLFGHAFLSIYVLFMARNLGLGATAIGLVFATGGVGALIGATTADRVARRFGQGWALIGGQFGFGATGLLADLLRERRQPPSDHHPGHHPGAGQCLTSTRFAGDDN